MKSLFASAASVIRGLDPDKYEAVPIGITKEGHWLIGRRRTKNVAGSLEGRPARHDDRRSH